MAILTTILALGMVFWIVILAIAIALFIFWIFMLIDAIKRHKTGWIILLIVSLLIGIFNLVVTLIYYFTEYKKRKRR